MATEVYCNCFNRDVAKRRVCLVIGSYDGEGLSHLIGNLLGWTV